MPVGTMIVIPSVRVALSLTALVPVAAACSGERAKPARDAPPVPAAAQEVRAPARDAGAAWVPAEHKEGDGKWRDAGVYVDGVAVGVLWFGELPAALEPVWLEGERSLDFGPGAAGPRTAPTRVRRYRLRDYLVATGVPVARVRAVHIYGSRHAIAVVAGDELRRAGDRLYFAFGNETSGKPLVYFPPDLRTNTSFDHIAAVAVYVDREAPRLRPDGAVELAGQVQRDIPYHGEPLRGGVRVYVDDRLGAWIKRRSLEGQERLAERVGDELRWKLMPYLASLGVATGVVRAEVIFDEQRTLSLEGAALEGAFFTASPQARGTLLLGVERTPVQALALFTAARRRPGRMGHGAGKPGD